MNQDKSEKNLNKSGNRRGMNVNSRKNLRNDANPNGRPKKADCLLDCIKEELGKVAINGQTNEQLIAAMLVSTATKGNIKATELMMSYLHAKPSQGIKIGEDSENPIKSFVFVMPSGERKTAGEVASDTK